MSVKTMLYRVGSMIKCGPHLLDWVKAEAHEIEDYLANGWHKTPAAAQDAHDAAQATPAPAEATAEAPAPKARRPRKPKAEAAPEANTDGNAD